MESSRKKTTMIRQSKKKEKSGESNETLEETASCPKCEKDVSGTDEALQCEICQNWYHLKCQNINKKIYKFLSSKDGQDLHWYCSVCDKLALNVIKSMTQMETRIQNLELEVKCKADAAHVNSKFQEIDTKLEKLNEFKNIADENFIELDTFITQTEEKLCTLEEKPDPTASQVKSTKEIQSIEENILTELEDRQKRQLNLVMFNVTECQSDDVQTRIQYDINRLSELLEELDEDPEIKKVIRIGKKQETNEKPRPLKVTLNTLQSKKRVLQKAKNLKNSNEEWLKEVFIKPDMTPAQREKNRMLWKELQEKNSYNDGNKWRIKDGRIVKDDKLEEEKKSPPV